MGQYTVVCTGERLVSQWTWRKSELQFCGEDHTLRFTVTTKVSVETIISPCWTMWTLKRNKGSSLRSQQRGFTFLTQLSSTLGNRSLGTPWLTCPAWTGSW